MRATSTLTLHGPLPDFEPEVVRDEPSLCRVPIRTAQRAGPVHAAFVAALPAAWRADPRVEVFSRMQWMKRGWLPATLDFHLDWPTPPDSGRVVETLMANFGGVSHTEFVEGALELPDAPHAGPRERRQLWRDHVHALVASGALSTRPLPSGVLAHFDNRAWHRPTPAHATGWRLLVRAIRGLPDDMRAEPHSRFTSTRNDHHPRTPEEAARYAPYAPA